MAYLYSPDSLVVADFRDFAVSFLQHACRVLRLPECGRRVAGLRSISYGRQSVEHLLRCGADSFGQVGHSVLATRDCCESIFKAERFNVCFSFLCRLFWLCYWL